MAAVIQHFSSINNAFISTVDHLPCDIVRSIWLIQSINLSLSKHRAEVKAVLRRLQLDINTEEKDELTSQVIALKEKIKSLDEEGIMEAEALHNQIMIHRLSLIEELGQLRTLLDAKKDDAIDSEEKDVLREQLKNHYKLNPLKSQREAVKERANKIKSKSSGIKLVLKMPKKSKTKLGKVKGNDRNKISKKKRKTAKLNKNVMTPLYDVMPPTPQVEVDNNVYCFCKQPSFGDMIGCDNEESCPNGDWFHYKCVGLLNRVDALKYTTGKQKWFCSDYCHKIVEGKKKTSTVYKKKKKRKNW
ncbi:uncharacterized protein PRCAT00005902001 [Priceomyces carsonii]|uniref:uncharacterized protein n=1 Tax=Priceomyces carsonii TaxID=28549 RepID=UPI002EDB8B7C|nr:unnamed protein product [Priceomyces carsonii]